MLGRGLEIRGLCCGMKTQVVAKRRVRRGRARSMERERKEFDVERERGEGLITTAASRRKSEG